MYLITTLYYVMHVSLQIGSLLQAKLSGSTHTFKQKNQVPFGLFSIKFSRIIQLVLMIWYLWPIFIITLDVS